MNQKTKGIVCIVITAFFFALMSVFVRLAGDLPSMQKSFFRNLVAVFFAALLLLRNRQPVSLDRDRVVALGLRTTGEASTPFCFSTETRVSPKPSVPTLPTKETEAPSLAAATATLAGAPPGLAANRPTPWSLTPNWVRSMRTSPMAVISGMGNNSFSGRAGFQWNVQRK